MGKRRKGDGGVRPASDTSIEIDFYYAGARCREKVKLKPNPRNITFCENWKARIKHEIAVGTFDYAEHFPDSPRLTRYAAPAQVITVAQQLRAWLDLVHGQSAASTYRVYRTLVEHHLIPAFGDLRLTELRRYHVRDWARRQEAMTDKTLRNTLSPLRCALDLAVEDELIDANPLAGWRLPKRGRAPKRRDDDIDPFSQAERRAILAALDGQGRNMVQFWMWAGLRTSELVALDWPDIDWIRGVARVWRALTQGAAEPEATKTAAGTREVKLLAPALDALRAQKAYTYLKGAEVFQNPRTGERWTGDQPIRKTLWQPALRRAGVRYRYPYQCRHTYASMLLMAGEDVRWVSQQLGHTSWAFTARVYARFIPDDAPEAGKLAEVRWSRSGHDEDSGI